MVLYAGQVPTASELDALGGRLVGGWDTTTPSAPFTTLETDLWSISFTPPSSGTYLFHSITPFDGTSGEQAKYRLYVAGTERRFKIEIMKAGSFVDGVAMWAVVDLASTSTVTVKATGIRTSGSNTIQCRINARQLYIFKVEKTGSALISP